MRVHIVLILVAAAALAGAQSARRAASLIIIGGTVLTEDAAHRALTPGAVVINGADIVDVDRPDVIARRYIAADTINAVGQVVLPMAEVRLQIADLVERAFRSAV